MYNEFHSHKSVKLVLHVVLPTCEHHRVLAQKKWVVAVSVDAVDVVAIS